MKRTAMHSHRFGEQAVDTHGLLGAVQALVNAPKVIAGDKSATTIKAHIEAQLTASAWALDVPVRPGSRLTINAVKDRVALQTQTGNAARVAYDLLKFQAAHLAGAIDVAVLIVPTQAAAQRMGSNLANYERVVSELGTFGQIIYVPLLVIAFT